jgi:hypothetical protein
MQLLVSGEMNHCARQNVKYDALHHGNVSGRANQTGQSEDGTISSASKRSISRDRFGEARKWQGKDLE